MNKDKDQIMISIGGFGGCNLSEALKKIPSKDITILTKLVDTKPK